MDKRRERGHKARAVVASHKDYWMPEDSLYIPLEVGAALRHSSPEEPSWSGFTRDDTGESISDRNRTFCELTGLYWAWKNLDSDYIGLVHYRRHFTVRRKGPKRERPLTERQLLRVMKRTDIVLPLRRHYYIETNYSQYAHAHHSIDLDTTRVIISEKYPEYLDVYDRVMKRTSGHRFNMFIMKREYLEQYSEWLFDILFELEGRLDISDYSLNDSRVFGFVSERLLDVWIEANGLEYVELPYVFMERQNWLRKGAGFLLRKLRRA